MVTKKIRISYAECPFGDIDDDLGWEGMANMYCSHPDNSFDLGSLGAGQHGCVFDKMDWHIAIDDYMRIVHKEGFCKFYRRHVRNEERKRFRT